MKMVKIVVLFFFFTSEFSPKSNAYANERKESEKSETKNPFKKGRIKKRGSKSKYKLNLELSDEKIRTGEDASINELLDISKKQYTGEENVFLEIKNDWKHQVWNSINRIEN